MWGPKQANGKHTNNLRLDMRISDKKIGGAVICIDQEKAFDGVNHHDLLKVLKEMGFNGNFLKCIQTVYNNITNHCKWKAADTKEISRSVR